MDWIDRLKYDSNAALNELYADYRGEALQWLLRERGVEQDAGLDIFQQSVITLYQNVKTDKLTELTSGIKTYLFGIMKNKAREWERRYSKELSVAAVGDMPIDASEQASEDMQSDRIARVATGLRKLGDPCMSLLQHFYYDRLSIRDIAQKMGYKDNNSCKAKKYTCLKRLQSIVLSHQRITATL